MRSKKLYLVHNGLDSELDSFKTRICLTMDKAIEYRDQLKEDGFNWAKIERVLVYE